jgi:hypothetical protein
MITIFAELVVALVLSYVLVRGYRALSAVEAGRETVATDLFLGIGVVAVTVLWIQLLSTALVA